MNVLQALAGAILVLVGIVWGVLGLLHFAEGVYGAATTGLAVSSAAIFRVSLQKIHPSDLSCVMRTDPLFGWSCSDGWQFSLGR